MARIAFACGRSFHAHGTVRGSGNDLDTVLTPAHAPPAPPTTPRGRRSLQGCLLLTSIPLTPPASVMIDAMHNRRAVPRSGAGVMAGPDEDAAEVVVVGAVERSCVDPRVLIEAERYPALCGGQVRKSRMFVAGPQCSFEALRPHASRYSQTTRSVKANREDNVKTSESSR